MRKLLLKSAPSCIYIHPPDPCNDCKNKVSLLLDKIIAYGTCKNRKLILISVLVTHRFQCHNVSSFLNLQQGCRKYKSGDLDHGPTQKVTRRKRQQRRCFGKKNSDFGHFPTSGEQLFCIFRNSGCTVLLWTEGPKGGTTGQRWAG